MPDEIGSVSNVIDKLHKFRNLNTFFTAPKFLACKLL